MNPVSMNYGPSAQQYGQQYPQQMQYPPQYPAYPNCFDMLTTHGVIADDLVGYVNGTPSPYLQNYVAQRGWNPTMPGQVMPDPLPNVQPQRPLPNDVYQPVINQNFIEPKQSPWKKIAAGVLLTGLAVLGLVKGKKLVSKLFAKTPAATTAATAGRTV